MAAHRQGRLDLAILEWTKATSLRKDDAGAWRELALCQREKGDTLSAMGAIQESLSLDPSQADLSNLLTELAIGGIWRVQPLLELALLVPARGCLRLQSCPRGSSQSSARSDAELPETLKSYPLSRDMNPVYEDAAMNPRRSRSYRGPLLLGLVALIAGLVMFVAKRERQDDPHSTYTSRNAKQVRSEGKAAGTGTVSESVPKPSQSTSPTGAPIAIPSTREVIQERDGAFGYRGQHYLFTADSNGITTALPVRMRNSKRPTLTLALQDIRVGDRILVQGGASPPALNRPDRTIVYSRGSVGERYIVRKDALEQDFVIHELPADRGELVVRTLVQSNLAPPAEGAKGSELHFNGPNQERFAISKAIAVDAAGRKLPLELAY